jgi:hypothetical protein
MGKTVIVKRGENDFELIDLTDEETCIVGLMGFLNIINSTESLAKLAMRITFDRTQHIPGIAMSHVMNQYGEESVDQIAELMRRISFSGQLSATYFSMLPEDAKRAGEMLEIGNEPDSLIRAEYLAWAERKEILVAEDELEKFMRGGSDESQ